MASSSTLPPTEPASVKVFAPPASHASPGELTDEFFEPSLSDVQAQHASTLARSHRLNDGPLLTSKHRDEERALKEKKKADKWPTTTIRVRFSDGTQIQSTFPSTSPIQPVYAFVRASLRPEASAKPFVLWQPPRTRYPEHPPPVPAGTGKKPNPHKTSIIPPANYGAVRGAVAPGLQGGTGGKETLNELGLVPQSVLLIKWDDEAMNVSGYPAPLLDSLLEKIVPLPPAVPKEQQPSTAKPAQTAKPDGEKKIPKWLQKGLMKRK